MIEQPENPIAVPSLKAPLRKPVLAWASVFFLYAVTLGMAGFAITLIRHSFRSGIPFDDRVYLLTGAAVLLAFPVRVAWVYIRSKWTSGHWLMTKEESARMRSHCSTQRIGVTQTPPWSWIWFALNWANYSAREPNTSLWRRALGWALLAAFAAVIFAAAGLGIIFIGAGLDSIHSGGLVIVGIGAILLLIPILTAWFCILRKRRTGSLRSHQEDLQQMGVQQTEWQTKESQKPLKSKIVSTVIIVIILGGWWMRETLNYSRHSHADWVNPGLWTLFGIYAIWIQFRKPKGSQP